MKKIYLSLLMAMVCSWGIAQTIFEFALANQAESDAFVAAIPGNGFSTTGTVTSAQWAGTYGVKINGNSSLTYDASGLTAGDYLFEGIFMAQNVSHLWTQDVWETGGTVATPIQNAGTAGSYVSYSRTVTVASGGDFTFGIVRPSAGSQLFVKEWKVTKVDANAESSENDILTFELTEQTGSAVISTQNHTVNIEVATGTDVSTLTPTITTSESSTISPLTGVQTDFTNAVVYTVTAEDETTQDWTVTVSVAVPLPAGTLFQVVLDGESECDAFRNSPPANFGSTGSLTSGQYGGQAFGVKISGNGSIYYTATNLTAGQYVMEGSFLVQNSATLPWNQGVWETSGGTPPTAETQDGTSGVYATYTKTVNVLSTGDYTFGIVLGNTGAQFYMNSWKVTEAPAAAVITWNGSAWSGGIAPMSGDDAVIDGLLETGSLDVNSLTINSGATLTVASGESVIVNGSLINDGTLNVASGASLVTMGAVTGDATITRNTTFGDAEPKYSFVGTPVAQSASITGSDLGSHVYKYNEVTPFDADQGLTRWENAASDELVPGIGYTQASQKVISFTGVPNTGDITVTGLTKSTINTVPAEQGWHLLSNPYPAAIDVADFLSGNSASIENSISIWDDGSGTGGGRGNGGSYLQASSIATVNGVSKDFEGYIGSTQGFFVKAKSDDVDVTFTNEMRVSGNNADATFFRKAKNSTAGIKVSISNNSFFNELFVGLIEGASIGYDASLEATKFIGGTDLEFYSLTDDTRLAIQALPFELNAVTELAFDLGESSDLNFTVESLTGLESGMTFWLHDAVTGLDYNLSEVQNFTFSASSGSNQNRFTLTYAPASVLSHELSSSQVIYSYNNGVLAVDFASVLNVKEYAVYDLSGKVLVQNRIAEMNVQNLTISVPNKGINIVKIHTSEGVITRKFIF